MSNLMPIGIKFATTPYIDITFTDWTNVVMSMNMSHTF